MEVRVRRPKSLRGTIIVPGDKSISHRVALLNAIADGDATVENFLTGDDCRSTLDCLAALGVVWSLEEGAAPRLQITGRGRRGLRQPEDVLDAGNSGTTMRLLAGILAGQPFFSAITGDASLRGRPMSRIVEPLRAMGAQVLGRDGPDGEVLPPLAVQGGPLRGISYRSPVASAQVKSCVLLAGLYASGDTTVEEPALTRDHTERMLSAMGASLTREATAVRLVRLPDAQLLRPLDLTVPGDVSAASFWITAAVLHPDAELRLPGVGVNPTRTGLIDVLRAMGAGIDVGEERLQGGEPVADVTARSSRLTATEIDGAMVPRVLDELPLVALAAAFATGRTVIRDAAELRVKEADRLAAVAGELGRLGASIEETADGLTVEGPTALRGGAASSRGDHRLAMALAVAGLTGDGETVVRDAEAASVSYPGFWNELARLAG